jgi:hypothetical protein
MQEVHTALTTGASLEYQVQILGHCNSVLHSTCMLLIAVVKRLWVLCPWPLGVVNEVPRCGKLIAYISIRNSVGRPYKEAKSVNEPAASRTDSELTSFRICCAVRLEQRPFKPPLYVQRYQLGYHR